MNGIDNIIFVVSQFSQKSTLHKYGMWEWCDERNFSSMCRSLI